MWKINDIKTLIKVYGESATLKDVLKKCKGIENINAISAVVLGKLPQEKMWLNIGNAAIDMNVIARNVTFATQKDIQNMNTNQKWCRTDGSSLKQV